MGVTVTLKTVGTTVEADMTDVPDRVVKVLVKDEVVREREAEVEEGAAEVELDWATTGLRRTSAATADHEQRRRRSMADGRSGGMVVG